MKRLVVYSPTHRYELFMKERELRRDGILIADHIFRVTKPKIGEDWIIMYEDGLTYESRNYTLKIHDVIGIEEELF